MTLAGFLAWPDGSGLAGTAILGVLGYVHTHVRLGRQHAERMAQAERLGTGTEPAQAPEADALPEMTEAEIERRLRTWARRDPRGFESTLARINRSHGRSNRL